jgi:hypothetical protein
VLQWTESLDLLGSFPTTSIENKFLLVLTDHFSKWVTCPVKDQTAITCAEILSKEFGVPWLYTPIKAEVSSPNYSTSYVTCSAPKRLGPAPEIINVMDLKKDTIKL